MKSRVIGIFEQKGLYTRGVGKVWVGAAYRGTRAGEGFTYSPSEYIENNWFSKWTARAIAPKQLSTWTS